MERINSARLRARCAICGTTKVSAAQWFSVTEDCGMDRLKVWGWNKYSGDARQAHGVCSRHHVRELIFHWMRTGCLQYPFATKPRARQRLQKPALERGTSNYLQLRPLAEVTVDRPSIERILTENPLSLNTLLDELMIALEKEVGDNQQDEFDGGYRISTGSY